GWALATALPASCAALAGLALVCARRLHASRLADVGRTALSALVLVPEAAVDAVQWPGRAMERGARARVEGALRGLALGLPLAFVFVAILAADEAFRGALSAMVAHSGSFASGGFWALFVFAELTLATAVLLRIRSRADEAAAPDAAPRAPYRVVGEGPPS